MTAHAPAAPPHRLRRRLLRRPHRRGAARWSTRSSPAGGAGQRFLIFETLAERTLALAQLARRADPESGLRAAARRPAAAGAGALPRRTASASSATSARPTRAARRGTSPRWPRELGLAGAAHRGGRGRRPVGAGAAAPLLARALGARDATASRRSSAPTPTSAPSRSPPRSMPARRSSSAAASPTLRSPSARRWRTSAGPRDDWDRLGRATMAGHLLECGAQVCGGYFADPGYKDVPGLATSASRSPRSTPTATARSASRTAPAASSTSTTVKEQLLYEVHDPAAYLTPDVVADICARRGRRAGRRPRGASTACAATRDRRRCKVNVCHEGGWLAEGEISYAGAARRGARPARRARCCASAWPASAAARRPDRRRQRARRRRRPLAGSARPRRRPRRAPARRR